MRNQYEDPRKSELRERFWVALDAAGYDVEPEPEPIEIPVDTGLQGRIVPDLTSLDGTGRFTAYFLRPSATKPLPQWLANWSRATKLMDQVDLYVVTQETPSQDLVRSCETVGAGILILRIEGLERVLEAGVITDAKEQQQWRQRIGDLRRRLENKLHLQLDAIDKNFTQAQAITSQFPDDVEDEYIDSIESDGVNWRRWGEELSARLDALASSQDEDELREVERRLQAGPT